MPLNYHKPGIGSTAEFQSSGVPFITSDTSSYTVDLEFVTSAVVVCSTGDDNSVAFGNLNDGVFTLPNGAPVRFEVKCKHCLRLTNHRWHWLGRRIIVTFNTRIK